MEHDRVNITTTAISCGVMALSRISDDTDNVLYSIASRLYHPSRGEPCAQFIASDLSEEGTSTEKLMRRVSALHFDTDLIWSDVVENPKTGHVIQTIIWTINHENFKSWYSEERVRRLQKVGT